MFVTSVFSLDCHEYLLRLYESNLGKRHSADVRTISIVRKKRLLLRLYNSELREDH